MPAATVTTLGVIAGNRSLPLEFARLAREQGVERLVAVAFEGETQPELIEFVDDLVWVRVGQLGKLIDALTSRGVRHCVMVGQVAPRNLFDLRPDLRALKLLWRLKEKNAHTIFGAIAEELARDGVELIEATPWLAPLMPATGFRLGPAPSAELEADLAFGLRIAKETSRLDIGQSVVVKQGAVLAVEAWEGTDACLRRGGELAGPKGGAVGVKVAKASHDLRFDLPCIGAQTIEACVAARYAGFGFEAGRTLLLEREQVTRLVERHRLPIVALS
jgi:hypothetical protein